MLPLRPGSNPTALPKPERSPLEPLSAYASRLKKWENDNATRRGQSRALELLDSKTTRIPPNAARIAE